MKEIIIKGIKKIEMLSAPVKASFAFTICSIIQKGIGFITTPIFVRLMNKEEYGIYSLYLSWYSIVILLASLNLSIAYNNALTKYEKHEEKVMSSFLGISTLISLLFLIFFLMKPIFWQEVFGLPTVIILLMLFQCLVEPAFHLWSVRERFYFKYKKIIFATLFIAVGSPALGIIMVYISQDKALARVASNIIIVGILYLLTYIVAFVKGKCFFDREYWKFGLTMCIPLIPHFLSQTVLNQADRIMISKMVGDDKTAIYSVAYTIAAVVSIVITSINNSLLPYIYQNLKKHNLQMKYQISKLISIVGMLCLFVMLFGPEFIQIVGGTKYYEAIWVIPSITTATYFTFIFSIFANFEFYYEKTVYMAIGSVIAAVINIILNYFLIPLFGYFIAGYTTLIGFMFLTIFHFISYRVVIKNKKWITEDIVDIKYVLIFSIIMIALMVAVLILYNYRIVRYIFISVMLIAFILNIKKFLTIIN